MISEAANWSERVEKWAGVSMQSIRIGRLADQGIFMVSAVAEDSSWFPKCLPESG